MTDLPYKYRVTYAHLDDRKPEDDPNRHGWGEIEYDSEKPVVTQDDMKDVARWIGQPGTAVENGFTAVGITKILNVLDDTSVSS